MVYGWRIVTKRTVYTYGHPVIRWLKEHGFHNTGGKWLLSSDTDPACLSPEEPLSHAEAMLKALQQEFPTCGISLGYIGNIYGQPGTPAFRDDRLFAVFTKVKSRGSNERVSIVVDWRKMTIEEVRRRCAKEIALKADTDWCD
jgi:hypothetical protein